MCRRIGCCERAVCAVGFALYPTMALMKYYGTVDEPLLTVALSFEVCATHFDSFEVGDVLDDETFERWAKVAFDNTGIVVDRTLTKLCPLPFTDPGYIQARDERVRLSRTVS